MAGKVRCMDCGYLQLLRPGVLWEQTMRNGTPSSFLDASTELPTSAREKVKLRGFSQAVHLGCYRKIDLADATERPMPQREYERRIYNSCLQYQRCPFFYPYSPGHSPREHLDRHDEKLKSQDARRWTRNLQTLFAASIATGLVAGLLLRPSVENIFQRLFG